MRLKLLLVILINLQMAFIYCQQKDFKFPTKFISFKHARLSLGLDGGITGSELYILSSKPDYKSFISSGRSMYYANGIFDIYAPNSTVGFQFGIGYKLSLFTLQSSNNYSNFDLSYISLPLYIKIRPGNHLNRGHLMMLIGANYNIPLNAKVKDIFFSNPNVEGKEILANQVVAEFSVGYEHSMGKKSMNLTEFMTGSGLTQVILSNTDVARFYVYIKGGYALNNIFNSNYEWNKYTVGKNWDLTNHYVAIGFVFYFRLAMFSERNL